MYINWLSSNSTALDSSCPISACAYRGVSACPSQRGLMRIEAPSTAHNIAGRSSSPVGSISMAPKPPVKASSIACSMSVRKLSTAFGSSSIRRSARNFFFAKATSSAFAPRRTRTCQSIAAIRSLITLIARRTTGVSANRRRFAGVGLGKCRPGNWTGVRIDGSANVFRSASASAAPDIMSALRLVACLQISRNCSPTLTCTFPFPLPKIKRHSPGKGHALISPIFERSVIRVYLPTDNFQPH